MLFTVWTGVSSDDARIGVLSLETGERRVLFGGGACARYVPSGHLVYARAGGLVAVPFDLKRLEVTGPPVSILERVSMSPYNGRADFGLSGPMFPEGRGSASVPFSGWTAGERPNRFRRPHVRTSCLGSRLTASASLSASKALSLGCGFYEPARGTLSRLMESPGIPRSVWTPDGKHVTFSYLQSGSTNLYWMLADGSGAAEGLTASENFLMPGSWSPDGQLLAFSEADPTTGFDIWVLGLQGDRKPRPFLQTPSNEYEPMFSPDGHWLAYGSDETGRHEIYVRPFTGPGGKMQISTEGGVEPMCSRNGRELFYRNGDKMMVAAVETEPVFAASKPKLLFEGHYEAGIFPFERDYDVSPDGQRFLMIKASEQESPPRQLNVVLNWSDELGRLAPAGKP